MTPGAKIIQLREDMDINQTELSQRIGINRSVLNRIEQGTRPIRDDELKQFAEFFGVSSDYIIGRDTEPGYYLDAETAKRAEAMRDRPGLRVLFDASRKLTPTDLDEVNALIEAKLKKPEYDE